MTGSNCDGQLSLLDLVDGTEPVGNPAVITVHCFFARWCNYVVRDTNPEAGRRMEAHYVAKHYGKHLATIYKEKDEALTRIHPGGSLKKDGFFCRYCNFEALADEYIPGESMRLAAEAGTAHMKDAHHATLDGQPLTKDSSK